MPQGFPVDLETLRTVLDYLNIGVYITDTDRRIMLWNRQAEEITGYAAADVVGRRCADDVLQHVDKDGQGLCGTDLCPLFRSMKTGKESDEPILVYARKADGKRVAVTVSTAPLRGKGGDVVGGVETFRNASGLIRDLEMAQEVQRHLLPESMPAIEGYGFDVAYHPHDQVGGDFYDVREIGVSRCAVLVADVRGHGVSAALYTMLLKSLEESHEDLGARPEALAATLSRELSRFFTRSGFASAFYGVLDSARHEITYTDAGHPPVFHFRAEQGAVEHLQRGGILLGVAPEFEYQSWSAFLAPGDVLLCYTDGATDVPDGEGEMLGIEGLSGLFVEEVAAGPAGLPGRLYRRLSDHCGEVSMQDDVLLLSIARER